MGNIIVAWWYLKSVSVLISGINLYSYWSALVMIIIGAFGPQLFVFKQLQFMLLYISFGYWIWPQHGAIRFECSGQQKTGLFGWLSHRVNRSRKNKSLFRWAWKYLSALLHTVVLDSSKYKERFFNFKL